MDDGDAWRRPLSYILTDDGTPQACDDLLAHATWRITMWANPHVRIGDDTVDGQRISTVFLGCDLAVSGPPVLWETMVFGATEPFVAGRYQSAEAARVGHRSVVAMIRGVPQV